MVPALLNVHLIQTALTENATVTESAIVVNVDNDIQTEVDILIEAEIGGTLIKLAVEVRDRKRKATVEWIRWRCLQSR